MLTVSVEVFKTNVQHPEQAALLRALLDTHFPGSRVTFDLEDCDKVLRMEGGNIITEKVIVLLEQQGFTCDELQ